MSDYGMEAYWYEFDNTGTKEVDKILSAVACAGKSFHRTEDWNEKVGPWGTHSGETPIEWIQNAANEASKEIADLKAKLAIAVEALETLKVAVNDKQNDPGATSFIISALAKIKGDGHE